MLGRFYYSLSYQNDMYCKLGSERGGGGHPRPPSKSATAYFK